MAQLEGAPLALIRGNTSLHHQHLASQEQGGEVLGALKTVLPLLHFCCSGGGCLNLSLLALERQADGPQAPSQTTLLHTPAAVLHHFQLSKQHNMEVAGVMAIGRP